MFFFKRRLSNKINNFIDISIDEHRTNIRIYENGNLLDSISNTIEYGYKDIIEQSYKKMKLSNDIKCLSLDDFVINHSNFLRQDVSVFMIHIEFKILCGPPLPFKIDKIKFNCDGPKLFEKEFKARFSSYNI